MREFISKARDHRHELRSREEKLRRDALGSDDNFLREEKREFSFLLLLARRNIQLRSIFRIKFPQKIY